MKARKSEDNPRNPVLKKKAIRDMRKGETGVPQEDGRTATHIMAWDGPIDKKRGNFTVYPTIAPKKGKEGSTDPSDWTEQGPEEAAKRGELIRVNRRIKAEKLAAGSWKKGQDRREAMSEYRRSKRGKG
jgi:hypothetical protein